MKVILTAVLLVWLAFILGGRYDKARSAEKCPNARCWVTDQYGIWREGKPKYTYGGKRL